jgi:Tol biopolymer transport system component
MGEVMLSPDDSQAAFSTFRSAGPDLWILDVARGVPTRLTSDPSGASAPIWSPDGKAIAFRSLRNGREDLYMRAADGSGTDQLLLSDEFSKIPESLSPDGRYLTYYAVGPPPRHRDLWVLPLFGDRRPFAFRESEKFREAFGHFSPDGRWMMYLSDETGRNEVYVAPFPGSGGKTQVSTAGGLQPRWRRDGKEIFYLWGRSLWAVPVKADSVRFEVGIPQRLFDVLWAGNHPFDVTRDGQRFLVSVAVTEEKDKEISLIVNWPALLRPAAAGRGSESGDP